MFSGTELSNRYHLGNNGVDLQFSIDLKTVLTLSTLEVLGFRRIK